MEYLILNWIILLMLPVILSLYVKNYYVFYVGELLAIIIGLLYLH